MTQFATVSRAEIDAALVRGRQLRSRYFADRFQELTRALIRRARGRDIARHLEDLPDYLLADIGIERAQIPALAAGRLGRRKSDLADAVCHRLGGIVGTRSVTAPAAPTIADAGWPERRPPLPPSPIHRRVTPGTPDLPPERPSGEPG